MRLSWAFQRLFKIKKETCSFCDATTVDCSLKLKKYVLARHMTNIGDRHEILALTMPCYAFLIRFLSCILNFRSTQTFWFLSCWNSIPENYDFWCVFIVHPSSFRIIWSSVKNLSRRLRNMSEQWWCCNWHQQVRPAIHGQKKCHYIHYMISY